MTAPQAVAMQWGAETLWERLVARLPGCSVEVAAECGSTNTELLERVRRAGAAGDDEAAAQPCLLVAETQTAGRGRHGRQWRARRGASLTFSLALPLQPLQPGGWSGLSLAVGVALADALEPTPAATPRIGLKWPNDLWLRDGTGAGRKLGGVLIETAGAGGQRVAVVGVGLNVLPQEADATWSSGYACLQALDPQASAPAALHAVALPLAEALLRFEREGYAAFAARYAARDLLRGQRVHTLGEPALAGVADGVDTDGALLLLDDSGTRRRISSGEVSVRLADGPGGGAC
jgi:BirA family biotin operon repressor/biotin-[acetyl-CoA-carboxylase] ligase